MLEDLGIIVKSIEHYPSHTDPGNSVEMQVRIETARGFTGAEIMRRLVGSATAYNNDPNAVTFPYNRACEDRDDHILENCGVDLVSEVVREEEEPPPPKKCKPSDEFERVGMQVCGLTKVVRKVAASLASEVMESIRSMEKGPVEYARLEEENLRLKGMAAENASLKAELEQASRERDDYALDFDQAKARADDAMRALEAQKRLTERALESLDDMTAQRDKLRNTV